MRTVVAACWLLFWFLVLGTAMWAIGIQPPLHTILTSAHALDWITGGICLLWLLILVKAPWDLFFKAYEVTFELERSNERDIPTRSERLVYLKRLRRRLGGLAVGLHLVSAIVVAAATWYSHGRVGYYFAGFYLLSTAFRPVGAAYVYLLRKLQALNHEARYPREDVETLRRRVDGHETALQALTDQIESCLRALEQETRVRESESREVRQQLHEIGREFEVTVSRLTDNQDVIRGIQAFVRLVGASRAIPSARAPEAPSA